MEIEDNLEALYRRPKFVTIFLKLLTTSFQKKVSTPKLIGGIKVILLLIAVVLMNYNYAGMRHQKEVTKPLRLQNVISTILSVYFYAKERLIGLAKLIVLVILPAA